MIGFALDLEEFTNCFVKEKTYETEIFLPNFDLAPNMEGIYRTDIKQASK